MRIGMMYMSKRQQPHRYENVSPRSSMNIEETITPQGRLQLTPEHHYTQVQGNTLRQRKVIYCFMVAIMCLLRIKISVLKYLGFSIDLTVIT